MFGRQNSTQIYQKGVSLERAGKFAEAFTQFKKAADLDNTDAQISIAEYYYRGRHTEQNYSEALYWYEKAAEKGDSKGQYNCAYMYYHGTGCEPDTDTALYWLNRAKTDHNWDGMMEGLKLEIDRDMAAKALDARKSSLMSQAVTGADQYRLYQRMSDSRDELYDTGNADIMFKRAIASRYKPAMWDFVNRKMAIVNRYARAEAIEVLTSLAEMDDEKAILQLYDLHREESRFYTSDQLAYKWGCRANELGLKELDYELGCLIRSADPAKALAHFLRAAEKKDSRAYQIIYQMYTNGEGCEQNDQLAFEYYTKAADAGTVSRSDYLKAAEKMDEGNQAYYTILYENALQDGDMESIRKCIDLCRRNPARKGDLEQFLRKACEAAAGQRRDISYEVDELTEYYEDELKAGSDKNTMFRKALQEKDDWAFVSRMWALENTGTGMNAHDLLLAFYRYRNNSHFKTNAYKQYLANTTNTQKINELLENGARFGNEEQIYLLAMQYACGIGLEKNKEAAKQLLEMAQQLGHPDAAKALSALAMSDEERQGMANVIEKYKDQNKVSAQERIAAMYRTAEGTAYSERNWMIHLQKAADLGSENAMMKLAGFCENQPYFYKETGDAYKYYAMASDKGNAEAAYRIGVLFEGITSDPVMAAGCWEYYLLAEKREHEKAHEKCEQLRASAGERYAEGAKCYQAKDYENMTAHWYPLVFLDNTRVLDLTSNLIMKYSVRLNFDMEYNVLSRVLKRKPDAAMEEHLAMTLAENGYFSEAADYAKKAVKHGSVSAYWLVYRILNAMNDTINAEIYLYEGCGKGNGNCCMVHALECVEEYNTPAGTEGMLRSARKSAEIAAKQNVPGAAELLKEVNRVLAGYESARAARKAELELMEFERQRAAEEAERKAEYDRLYNSGGSWLDFAKTVDDLYRPYQPFTAYDQDGNAYKIDAQTGRGYSYNGQAGYMTNDDLEDRARRLRKQLNGLDSW